MQSLKQKRSGEIFSLHMNLNHQERAVMTTSDHVSPTTTLSKKPTDDEVLSVGMLAYFQSRLSNRIHELVLEEFISLESRGVISRTSLAKKIRKKPEQVSRWLGSPGNWTIETLSDLLLGMGLEPEMVVRTIVSQKDSIGCGEDSHRYVFDLKVRSNFYSKEKLELVRKNELYDVRVGSSRRAQSYSICNDSKRPIGHGDEL